MHFIVFDLEWNTAGPGCQVDEELREQLPCEITELGAYRVSKTGELVDEFCAEIKPRVYLRLNPWIRKVTKQEFKELFRHGRPFEEVGRQFLDWVGDDAIICGWSDNDFAPLKSNLAFYDLPTTLAVRSMDVQHVFHMMIDPDQAQRPLNYAVDHFELAEEGRPFHHARDDAYYTALVLGSLLREVAHRGIKMELFLKAFTWDPNIVYKSQQRLMYRGDLAGLMDHARGLVLRCPACGKELTQEGDWKQRRFSCSWTGHCPDHGSVDAKLTARVAEGEVIDGRINIRLQKYAPVPGLTDGQRANGETHPTPRTADDAVQLK